MELNHMTPREFLLAYGVRLSRVQRDANRMSAAAFHKCYGVKAGEARSMIARIKEIENMPEHRKEAATITRRLVCMFARARGELRPLGAR
jgi:hypothetical protein